MLFFLHCLLFEYTALLVRVIVRYLERYGKAMVPIKTFKKTPLCGW